MKKEQVTQLEMGELPPKKTKDSYPQFSSSSKIQKVGFIVRGTLMMLVSAFLISFASYSIISPNNFVIGGVAGISIMLEKALGWRQSITTISLNLPLLILAFFFVRKRFALVSLCNIALQSVIFTLMEELGMPKFDFGEQQIFAALAAGICVGAAIAIAFKIGGSTGGMDIVAVIVQKKFPAPSIAWMIFFLNCIIISISFFVYRGEAQTPIEQIFPLIKAATEQYVESKANDSITNGFQSAIEFRVITNKPEEMSHALITRLSRGVTSIKATGMYTKQERAMLLCVIHRRQISAFRRIVQEIDPESFAVMSNVSQVLGLGFFNSEQ